MILAWPVKVPGAADIVGFKIFKSNWPVSLWNVISCLLSFLNQLKHLTGFCTFFFAFKVLHPFSISLLSSLLSFLSSFSSSSSFSFPHSLANTQKVWINFNDLYDLLWLYVTCRYNFTSRSFYRHSRGFKTQNLEN